MTHFTSISADHHQPFADTISFPAFVAGAQGFAAELREQYAATQLDDQDLRLLQQIGDPIDVLAILEDARPDAVATLAILARIEESTGKVRLHILLRDNAPAGQIPTYIFTDGVGKELGILAPGTAPVRERTRTHLDAFFAARARHDPGAVATGLPGLTAELKAQRRAEAVELRRTLLDLERSSFVLAIGELALSLRPQSLRKAPR